MEIKILEEIPYEEENYDPPGGSVWIVAVDIDGMVSVLETPNIHECFLESKNAEEMGLPCEVLDTPPGVYKWTCAYCEHVDWESGKVDDYTFEPFAEELLWKPE